MAVDFQLPEQKFPVELYAVQKYFAERKLDNDENF